VAERHPGVDVAWAPTLGLRLDLRVDGLGALHGLLATRPGHAHTVGFREAVVASVFYVGVGVVFGLIAGLDYGAEFCCARSTSGWVLRSPSATSSAR
jgi:hypothetical protein